MPIVQYSDSESEAENAIPSAHKNSAQQKHTSMIARRKRKVEDSELEVNRSKAPPLPSTFHSLYTTNTRSSVNDDPTLHGGRQRQVPHIQGNWPSHVYLEWLPTQRDMSLLDDYIDQAKSDLIRDFPRPATLKIFSSYKSDLQVSLPLHVSLSASLVLKTDNKDAFVESLKNSLENSSIRVFEVMFGKLNWVSNQDSSRHFLVLTLVQSKERELDSLLECCNSTCQHFDLPILYEKLGTVSAVRPQQDDYDSGRFERRPYKAVPSDGVRFHVTIAWTLEEPGLRAKLAVKEISLKELQISNLHFDTVKVKVGNATTDIVLKLE